MAEEGLSHMFAFDLDAIISFITSTDGDDVGSEITESYVLDGESNDLTLASRTIREIKNGNESSVSTIKYDLIKMFMEALIDAEVASSENPLTLGTVAIINTMMNNGMIKEIKNNE